MLHPRGTYYIDGWRDLILFFDQTLKLLSSFSQVLTEVVLSKIEVISG